MKKFTELELESAMTKEILKEKIIEQSFYLTINMGRESYNKVEKHRLELNRLVDIFLKKDL